MSTAIMPTYNRLPVTFVRGEGAWLWDDNGDKYLDALAGIAVCGLGHCHPNLVKAIQDQVATLMHVSNLYHIPAQQRLADKLVELSGMEQVFLANSGTEANEGCLKIARKYGNSKGIKNPKVIVMEHSFHGRSMAALSATCNEKIHDGFTPLLSGFERVSYADIDAIKALQSDPDVVAIHIEPIAGEGGIRIPPDGFLQELRKICDESSWLLMLDEVQTGIARTGQWFAYQHEGVKPDVLALAKGLGGGMPIGAVLVSGRATGVLQAGNHGTTFGGNPVACEAAMAVLDTIETENVLDNAIHQGNALIDQFNAELGSLAGVKQIRGRGLMIGIELNQSCADLVSAALKEHLLINVTAGSVIRLLPPLIISDTERQLIGDTIVSLVKSKLANHAAA